MGEIIIHRGNQAIDLSSLIPFTTVTKAEHVQELLSLDRINISIASTQPMVFYLGDYIIHEGRKFTLNLNPALKKQAENVYLYDLQFEGVQYDLLRKKYFNYDSEGNYTTGDFSLTGEIDVFLITLLNNAERDENEYDWIIGEFPANSETKSITFNNTNCLAALQMICSKENFDVEFEIVQDIVAKSNTLNIRKVGITRPYSFQYGMNEGLYGLSRANISEGQVITRLYPYGASDNIPTSYRNFSPRLRLPVSYGKDYIQDNAKVALYGLVEEIKNYDDIKPTFKGIISSVGTLNSTKGTMEISVSNMDFDLNEKKPDGSTKYLIPGTPAKIHINKGNLAGYEFEISKYTHSTKTFEIKQFADERGQKFPDTSTVFTFAVGDELVLLDIILPDSYITNAENKLKDKALEDYDKLSQNNVKYSLDIDPLYFANIGGGLGTKHLGVGDYVNIKDSALAIDKTSRIISLTRDLLNFSGYKYSADISDSYEVSIVMQILQDLDTVSTQIETITVRNREAMLSGYRRMLELQGLVFDTDGYFDPVNIKPNSIETNMLSVGAKSQQLTLESVVITANKNNNPNLVNISAGKLVHFSIDASGIKEWNLVSTEQTIPDNAARYIYARVSKGGTSGTFLITTNKIKFDAEANFYNFLIAVLFTPQNNIRLIELMYGSTFIHGRTITSGRIQSVDGLTWFDLDSGQIKGKIEFLPNSPAYDQISNSIVIGGRNLVRKSNQFIDSNGYLVKEYDLGEDIIDGQKYTITIETRAENQNINSFFGIWDSTGTVFISNVVKTSANIYQQAFAFPSGLTNKKKIRIYHLPNDATYYQIERVKLEKGNKATDWTPAPEDVQDAIAVAENSANTANSILSDISNDNKLTAQEKQALKKEYDIITGEKPQLQAQASTYGVNTANYITAYNNLVVYVNPLVVNLNTTTDIVGTVLRSTFSTYYTAKVNLLKAITDIVSDDLSVINDAVYEAQQTADSALSQIGDISSDSKLSPSEKQTTLNEWNRIKSEYSQNTATATGLSISITAYQNSYNALNTYITPLLSNLNTTSDIDGSVFRANFKAYYDQNIVIVSDIGKKQVEDIQIGGRNLAKNSKGLLDQNSYWVRDFDLTENLVVGNKYTVTVITNAVSQNSNAYFEIGDNVGRITYLNKKSPTRFEMSFIAPRTANKIILFREPNDSSYYQFLSLKLEKGNKATDWTPAPEDVDNDIATSNAISANALAQAQNAINTANNAAAVTNFLQTTINGNVVSTGTLQVGDVNGANAMISGVTDQPNGESIRFAAGKNYAQKYLSPFQVLDNGMVRFVNPVTGQKTFELGFNQNTGKVVFDIYNDNGIKVASIGPSGIQFTGYIPESYSKRKFKKLNTTSFTETDIKAEIIPGIMLKRLYDTYPREGLATDSTKYFYDIGFNTDTIAYEYNEGRNFESADNAQYSGFYTTANKFGTKLSDGIYLKQSVQSGMTQVSTGSNSIDYWTEAYLISNGRITAAMEIYKTLAIQPMPIKSTPWLPEDYE